MVRRTGIQKVDGSWRLGAMPPLTATGDASRGADWNDAGTVCQVRRKIAAAASQQISVRKTNPAVFSPDRQPDIGARLAPNIQRKKYTLIISLGIVKP